MTIKKIKPITSPVDPNAAPDTRNVKLGYNTNYRRFRQPPRSY